MGFDSARFERSGGHGGSRPVIGRLGIGLLSSLLGIVALSAVPAQAQVSTSGPPAVSGRSYLLHIGGVGGSGAPTGLLATVAGLVNPITDSFDTGDLPATGGNVTRNLLSLDGGATCATAQVICASVIREHIDGAAAADGTATSSAVGHAATATVLGVPGVANLLAATAVSSSTQVNCGGLTSPFTIFNGPAGTDGPVNSSTIASLSVLGIPINVLNQPNQVLLNLPVPVLGGTVTVTLNEQNAATTASPNGGVTQAASASAAVIDINNVGLLGSGRITLQHSDSDVEGCAPFRITKTSNGQVQVTQGPGTDIPFHITATNVTGALTCALVSVTDLLPPQPNEGGVPFTLVSSSGLPAGTARTESHPTGSSQNIETFTFPAPLSIPPGGSFAFDLLAHIPSNEPSGTYTNRAAFTSDCGAGSGAFITGVLTTIIVTGQVGLPATGSVAAPSGAGHGPGMWQWLATPIAITLLVYGGVILRRWARARPTA